MAQPGYKTKKSTLQDVKPIRTTPITLVNLRIRNTRMTKQVVSGPITISLHYKYQSANYGRDVRMAMGASIKIKEGEILSITCPHPKVKMSRLKLSGNGATLMLDTNLQIRHQFTRPPSRLREPITLRIKYREDGKTRTRQVAIDYRTNFGDRFRDAKDYAAHVKRYVDDPVISDLVSKSFFGRSLTGEIKQLNSIFNSQVSYRRDPLSFGVGGVLYRDYLQSPSDFLDCGFGDCEDYAAVCAAYLVKKGFKAYMVLVPGHAYLIAEDRNGKKYTIDIDGQKDKIQQKGKVQFTIKPLSEEEFQKLPEIYSADIAEVK